MSLNKKDLVKEFMVSTKQITDKDVSINCDNIGLHDKHLINLQVTMILEKLQELCSEVYTYNPISNFLESFIKFNKISNMPDSVNVESIANTLSDIDYNINTLSALFTIPLDDCFKEIHKANMSKVDHITGKTYLRLDGKVIPSLSYTAPDLKPILKL